MYLLLSRKSQNILTEILDKTAPFIIVFLVLLLWEILSVIGVVPKFMLPSPFEVVKAFIDDFPLLMHHTGITLIEAFLGLGLGIILGFLMAIIMDRFDFAYRSIYPVLVITQTIPTVAIAPLPVLWLGYGIMPNITLIAFTSFFPRPIGLLDGFKSADRDALNLLKTMGATPLQNFIHIKFPSSIGYFFAGLRISVSYSIIGAVVAEWLGGFDGLGVYMTRVRKSYSFDKMFAVIFFISAISLFLMYLVKKIQKAAMPWENNKVK